MCTELPSHIPAAESHNMAAGFVCSEDLCLSVERACSLFDMEISETQSTANANSAEFIGLQFSYTVNNGASMSFNCDIDVLYVCVRFHMHAYVSVCVSLCLTVHE